MYKKPVAIWSLLVIAVLMIGSSAFPAMSQSPRPVSALVKIDLRAEGDLQRIEARKLAVYAHLTTEDEDYLIAGVTEEDLAFLTSQGLAYRLLDEEFVPGGVLSGLPAPRRPVVLDLTAWQAPLL